MQNQFLHLAKKVCYNYSKIISLLIIYHHDHIVHQHNFILQGWHIYIEGVGLFQILCSPSIIISIGYLQESRVSPERFGINSYNVLIVGLWRKVVYYVSLCLLNVEFGGIGLYVQFMSFYVRRTTRTHLCKQRLGCKVATWVEIRERYVHRIGPTAEDNY